MKKLGGLFFVVHILFAIYFINFALNFFEVPEFIENVNQWIIFLGGVLIALAGLNHLKPKRKKKIKD
jgi:hypothetical protein